jgi:hypothetical protein
MALYDEHGLNIINGDEGVIMVSVVQGSRRLDADMARALLTPEQVEACTKQGDPTTKITFTARKA